MARVGREALPPYAFAATLRMLGIRVKVWKQQAGVFTIGDLRRGNVVKKKANIVASGEVWTHFAEGLKGETTRGAVLVSSALVENLLEDMIKNYLVRDKSTDDLIDGPMAPIGTFSAKIKLAFAVGLIDKRERDLCDLVRTIRNDFAHQMTVSLESGSGADKLKRLKVDLGGGAVIEEPGGKFMILAADLATRFSHRNEIIKLRPRQFDWFDEQG